MKRVISSFILLLVLSGSLAVVFSGCASSNYSKGFDEAD